MALQAKLLQKMGQSLMMTPQLQQAIKLLQLGRLEYLEAIQQELLENPVLEEMKDDDDDYSSDTQQAETEIIESDELPNSFDFGEPSNLTADSDSTESPADWDRCLENFTDYQGVSAPKSSSDGDERPSLEATVSNRPQSLREHLANQIRMLDISSEDQQVVITLLGNIDKNGFLSSDYSELAEQANTDIQHIEKVLCEISRSVEPSGVFARNLKECLLFQLHDHGLENSLAAKIISTHMDKLERRKYDLIAREEGASKEEIQQALQIIQSLEPRPGREFFDEDTQYVTPDIYVYKDGDDYLITLNEDGLPKIRVSPYYLDVLKEAAAADSEQKLYLSEKLKSASWLIKSIHQRQQTIYKVTESIVKFQGEFLDHGISRLKPLVLKEVADDIGMHESTVSRVTTNKYVHTPQGVFELKFFFTTGLKSGAGEVSSSSIKERIKNLIAAEDPKKPISDQKIVEVLTKENVEIARRTVAKYREGLGIASSSQRKQIF